MVAWYLSPVLGTPLWLWGVFLAVVLLLVTFDLGILQKKGEEIGVRQSLRLSAFYITAGLLFGGWVWYNLGASAAMAYYTGFLIEKSLSLDNIFVISLIFGYFAVPRALQHRVLFWGIMGVIVLRGVMIGVGAAVVSTYEWTLYIFAAFLIVTGIRMMLPEKEDAHDMAQNKVLQFLRRHLRVSREMHGEKFFVKATDAKGRLVWFATPLFLTLCMVEISDVIFAVDSVPAIFSISTDPFLVYTSNIFAILGLRALYFALAAVLERFHYLKYSLAAVLVFIGSKVFLGDFVFGGKVPALLSLLVTFGILAAGVLYSLYRTRRAAPLALENGST